MQQQKLIFKHWISLSLVIVFKREGLAIIPQRVRQLTEAAAQPYCDFYNHIKDHRLKEHNTYRHKGLGYTGENSGTQGVNQDLVLCDSQHKQSGSIFGTQIQEQCGKAPATK